MQLFFLLIIGIGAFFAYQKLELVRDLGEKAIAAHACAPAPPRGGAGGGS